MTNEERDLITRFIQRVGGPAAGSGFAGSVPATTGLPPIDGAADALLADLFQRFPQARYRVTQYAFVQEHALAEAQNTIRQLQAQLTQAQAQMQPPAPVAPSPWGAAAQRGYPQPPAYATAQPPSPQPGMFQQQGSGFLGSALRTAAGVAGGIFAADALMGLFGGHGGLGGGFAGGGLSGGGLGGGLGAGSSPWGAGADPYDQGGAPKDFDQGAGGGWTDGSGAPDTNPGADAGADTGPDQGGIDQGGFDGDPNSI